MNADEVLIEAARQLFNEVVLAQRSAVDLADDLQHCSNLTPAESIVLAAAQMACGKKVA